MKKRLASGGTKQLIGTIVLLLSEIGLLGSFFALGSIVLELPSQVVFRASAGLGVSLLVLCIACVLLRAPSLLWQVPPLCLAVSAVAVGARILITLLFNHWQLLFGRVGLVGAILLAVGVAIGLAMKALQAHFLPTHGT